MNKVAKRLITFGVGLPIVMAICFLNFQHHLVLNIVGTVISGLCAYELHRMFEKQVPMFNKWLLIALTVLNPILNYIFICLSIDLNITIWLVIFELIFLMGFECFTNKTFENSVKKICAATLLIFYCGYMITFITRLTAIESVFIKNYSTHFLILYFIVVFLCDSAAWFFGVLFGKGSRGFIAASPNKSLIGFAGGVAGSIFFALMILLLFPETFGSFGDSWWKMVIIGFLCSISSIVGDLIESVFKRSCEVKDSGILMFGRGGVLDSLDSLLVTAPVFYACIYFLYLI